MTIERIADFAYYADGYGGDSPVQFNVQVTHEYYYRNDSNYLVSRTELCEVITADTLEDLYQKMAEIRVSKAERNRPGSEEKEVAYFGTIFLAIAEAEVNDALLEATPAWTAYTEKLAQARAAQERHEQMLKQQDAQKAEAAERAQLAYLSKKYGPPQ
ncbi:hypothetical protein CcrC1_gp323 [Caulobacter phage C1]|nr:hypothetical protein CcrC1_gp323 [Caulobacter phage C1]UTU08552.1 hypothetical protein CcrC2_gp324 [Caulobacter phage C2]UTU09068.1 hypothetical protein CcrJ4_gp319 [Caulobacter phage J4]UTU10185.1 hypothetical protein CcrRB23_gp323 [Caulobacter phage RB23]WGN97219.1 hypothetical protein [Bertelyvirus sp.]